MLRKARVADVMIFVPTLENIEDIWVNRLGLHLIRETGEWKMLEDPDTMQRIVFALGQVGTSWAIAIESDAVDDTKNLLSSVERNDYPSKDGNGFSVIRDNNGVPILIFGSD